MTDPYTQHLDSKREQHLSKITKENSQEYQYKYQLL